MLNKKNILNILERENSSELCQHFYRDNKMRFDEHGYITLYYDEAMFLIVNTGRNTASLIELLHLKIEIKLLQQCEI
jgi:hypothetical protein